jgi:predicted GNAT family acetyltransferase
MNVEHDEGQQRFVIHFEGEDAELRYDRPSPKLIDLQHTYVPDSARGHGAAETLARAAFDFARTHKLRVVPSCPFVRHWLEAHPELLDIVDAPYAKMIGRRVQ